MYKQTKCYKLRPANVDNEIYDLVKSGVLLSDILVSIRSNGECVWGEVTALERDEMELEMEKCEMTTEGMIDGNEYLYIYGCYSADKTKWEWRGNVYEIVDGKIES